MAKQFDIFTEVFDYGQKITKIAINMQTELFAKTIAKDVFKINIKSYKSTDHSIYYEGEATITDAYVSHYYDGERSTLGRYIILELAHEYQNPSTDTIFYDIKLDEDGKMNIYTSHNKMLNLEIEVIQVKDITVQDTIVISKDETYELNQIVSSLVDEFDYGQSGDLAYRLFKPAIKAKKHPLIIWVHGSGEGGTNNETQLLANKGAVAFATKNTQRIFNGAYVLAPQCPDHWIMGSKDYVRDVLLMIKDVVSEYKNIDTQKIMLIGCSAGAHMCWKIVEAAPNLFSCVVPICGSEETQEDLLKVKHVPIWMVHSENDNIVPYQYSVNNMQKLKKAKGNVTLTSYNKVFYNGIEYNGHFAWVYALNNVPVNKEGVTLFEWMASQVKTDRYRKAKITTAALTTASVVALSLLKIKKSKK